MLIPITSPVPAWAYSRSPRATAVDIYTPTALESLIGFKKNIAASLFTIMSTLRSIAAAAAEENTDAAKIEETPIAEDVELLPSAVAPKPAVESHEAVVNQLPDDERESIYKYENNLGAPPGQVEADSFAAPPTTTDIKHRPSIGNFSFGIPLAGLAGRGIDVKVGMTYNSRTWNKSCLQYNSQAECIQNRFTYDVEESSMAPGFGSGMGNLTSYQRTRNVQINVGGGNYESKILTEIIPEGFTDSDGTRHVVACKAEEQIWNGHSSAKYCTTYGTSDGTSISLTRWTTTGSNKNYRIGDSTDWTLFPATGFNVTYPDGTHVTYTTASGTGNTRKHFPTSIRDRNGNLIRIYYKDGNGRIDYVLDTLHRKVKFHYQNDASGNPERLATVTIPGMAAEEEIQTVRFYYENMTLEAGGFASGSTVDGPTGPFKVLRWVYFPATKTGYKYDYHPKFGMINKISKLAGMQVNTTVTNQTGTVISDEIAAATTEYDFPAGNQSDVPKYSKRTDDWAERVAPELARVTVYETPANPGTGASTITAQGENIDVESKTYMSGGMVMETTLTERTGPRDGTTGKRLDDTNDRVMSKIKFTWTDSGRYLAKLEATNDAGLTKATVFTYDGYGNQTSVSEHDYAAPGTVGPLLRKTEMTYETGANWINNHLLGLVKSVKTTVGTTVVSKTLFEYDSGSLLVYGDIQGYDASFHPDYPPRTCTTECPDPLVEGFADDKEEVEPQNGIRCFQTCTGTYIASTRYRGNVTKVTRMLDVNASTPDPNRDDITELSYDIAGNVVTATLSCCQLKTIEYGANFGITGYAFPTKETKGSSPQLENLATYNRNTGLMLTSTNENGQTTEYQYEEDTLRPKKTILPNLSGTLVEYSDKISPGAPLPGFVRQTTTLEAGKQAVSYSYFDGRGLGFRSATQTPDGWSVSVVEYDQLGRVKKAYNPFYASTQLASVPAGTAFTTMTETDALGRNTRVHLQDGTNVVTHFSSANDIPTGFNKTFVIAVDQAGKQRRQVMDALGRVVRVDEPDASGDLGAVDAPAQPTVYEYDGNDNLAKVIQSDGTVTQERRFKYDALSRLTHEKQVEAAATLDAAGVEGPPDAATKWTKFLKYKPDGLLDYGIDARGVKTAFAYDGLNRVTAVNYLNETGYTTPNVTYTYDQARSGHFNAGALTRVETAAVGDAPATATEFDYDLMGRVVKHRQFIDTQVYSLEYGYNLAGQLVSEKYPSGKVVTTSYDANGRLAGVADQARTFVNGLQYAQHGGALTSMTLGNGTTETYGYNHRLQMVGQELKRGAEVLQKYDCGYGQIDGSGDLDTSKNNGQLARIESHIGTNKQWTQKFKYDSIGRLSEAEEKRGDTNALSYKQKFDYDSFGNMYRKAANNNPTGQQNPLPYSAIEEADIDRTTNRFATDTTYDEAGQVIADAKFREIGFTYDANGRTLSTGSGSDWASTVYDALGNRVATKTNDVWQYMIYDAFGKLVAEYGTSDGGNGVKYVQQDWQGSVRTTTTNAGFVSSRTDYTAFGEEIGAGVGLRTAQQGYGTAASQRQGYGLTEKDPTGLNHTWFRKNENRAGRWTSPDPYGGSMSLGDPQSFNRYSYVENQPTNFVDPSGLIRGAPRAGCVVVNNKWVCPPLSVPGGIMGTWDDPDPTTGGEEFPGGVGGSVAQQPEPSTDCDNFVDSILSAVEGMRNDFAARMRIGGHFADQTAQLFRVPKVQVSGFIRGLVEGGQDSDVWRHVLFGAASALLEGGVTSGLDDARQELQILFNYRVDESRASIAGNAAGHNIGLAIVNRIAGSLTAAQLSEKVSKVLCQK